MSTVLDPLPPEGKARLLKLIAFLKTLPPEKFNFGLVFQKRGCGSVGCAIGWTPEVFPELVEHVRDPLFILSFGIRLKGQMEDLPFTMIASILFMMPEETAGNLFCPLCQEEVHKDLPNCGYDASPDHVAAMLEQYLILTETPA